ncbi:DASS family sodium-coupled anion symporter [Endozoicomonas gorgoniicola]|uniref:DASS family sodium-coupled anion symporter n=1 Tax=Endozoicomonas gorgoniicola TaxID=1234144 RepID=A0ABT3N0C0_9GAMM|nr:DASS family sodium-coupled anion symporter [Endozoicomonas gorgoniicola]MCW7554803.1 DASS family sodium-coupled anion symporter [Endozoicomonas gorgoniicola]
MSQPPSENETPAVDAELGASRWLIGFVSGVLLLGITLLVPAPEGMSDPAWRCAGLAMMMAIFWSTEALPIPVTALLPLLLAPLLNLSGLDKVAAPYAHPVIFLFMGGFILGLAMERWNLHRRIALHTMLASGTGERRQVIGFMIATAFISMWVSNTATAIMMLPIGMSVIAMMRDHHQNQGEFPSALLLAIAYGASIGGFATLIGTPPNALLAAFLQEQYGIELGFAQWLIIGVPASVLMLIVTGWWLSRGGYSLRTEDNETVKHSLKQQLAEMGGLSRGEKAVATIFLLTAAGWIFRPLILRHFPGIALTDTTIALCGAIALFVIPVRWKKLAFLMGWKDIQRLPWDVLLLFGGGLSLAAMIRKTGLAEWIAGNMNILEGMPLLMAIGLVVTVIIFLTEITSNTATTAAFLPPLGALAVSLGMDPQMLAIPAAIAASCAFMLPVATPPNAIVFGSGMLSIRQMVRSGLILNLAGIAIITGLCSLLVGKIF